MSRRDRLRRGAEAKERVLSGVYNQPRQSVSAPSRRDRLKAPEVIAEMNLKERSGIDNGVRAMAPDLFNPAKQIDAFNKMVQPKESRPMFGPPAPEPEIATTPYEKWYQENIADSFIGKSLGGLQKADRAVSNVKAGALDTATFGATQGLGRLAIKTTPEGEKNLLPELNKRIGSPSYKVGEVAGYLAPGAAIERGAATALRPIIKNLPGIARAGITGATVGAAETLGQETGDVAFRGRTFDPANIAIGAAIGGGGGALLAGLGKGIGAIYNRLRSNNIPDEMIQEILALPAPRQRGNVNTAQTPDVMPGFGGGRLPELPAPGPLGLPEPRFAQPTAQQSALPLPRNMDRIQRAQGTVLPQGEGTIFSPSSSAPTSARIGQKPNPYRQQFEALMQRAKEIQDQGGFTPGREMEELESLWSQMAGRDAVGIDELIQRAYVAKPNRVTPDLVQRARSTQGAREVAGAPLPVRTQADRFPELQRTEGPAAPIVRKNVEYTPDQLAASGRVQQEFVQNLTRKQRLNTPIVGRVDSPVERVGRAPQGEVLPVNAPVQRPRINVGSTDRPAVQQPLRESGSVPKTNQLSRTPLNTKNNGQSANRMDVLKFGETVKNSQQTPKELSDLLAENPLTGRRTSDKLNHEQATRLIEKNGIEGTASRLLAKRNTLTPAEMTAAQMLAKHYSNLGGDENLQKAIEIISKTAREGRELGQAIQALSMYNKLDQEGALLLAERQLNRGVTDTSEWTKLSVEQAKPVQAAAKKIEEVQEARTLADQIVKMLADKPQGSALTDAEKSLIKQFEQQVKQVNDTVKPFMKKKLSEQDEVIKKVSNIQPKDRTRDQVVDFLEAKAAKAQARINRARNIGFADLGQGNIVVDLSIIGASKVAKGVVKASDFAEQMVREFGDHVKPYMNEAFVKATNIFRRENGIPSDAELNRVVTAAIKQNKLDDATANSLRAMASEIGFYLDNNLKKEAIQDLQLSMKSLGSSTLGEKIATLQTVAQLMSVPTFLRNALGNMGQIVLEKTNKMNAVPIDWVVSKFTGERTIKFFPKNQEKFWRNYSEGTVSGWKGVSPTGTLSSYDIHPNVFGEKNPLKYLTKTLGASLQGMDYAAYRLAYGDVVATYAEQIGKAQNLSRQQIKQQMPQLIAQLDQRILDMADQAGLYATYQDETMLSGAAQGIKRGLNSITDKPVRALVDKGVLPKWASTEGFGLGDVVLKYARTPANLVMRGIDYSPLGFMRGVYELAPLFINRGKFDQAKAVGALSRAITGTVGLTGIGYALADAGILTGAASSDADMRSMQEQSGQGAYKVNWSALGRYLTSGLDKDAAKHQKGDKMMDYAWAQPAAISLGMGVNANQIIKNQKPGDEKHGFDLAFQSIIGGLRTVLENPMVSGLSNVVDATTSLIKRNSGDGFANIVKGVPASFVPAVVGQARTSTDNQQRETFDENVFKTMMNLVKNKVPGLSKTLPVSYDSLGNQRERIQGGKANSLGQYLNSFVNPTKVTTYSASPEAKLVLDVLNDSQDPSVLPRIGQKYLMVDDPTTKENKRIDLTKEQFSRLQQRMGEMVSEELRKNEFYLSDQTRKIDKRVDRIKDILTKVGTKARNEVRVEMGYKKKK